MRRFYLGIKNPKIETPESITNYLVKADVDTINAHLLKEEFYVELITNRVAFFSKYEVYNSNYDKIKPSDSLLNQCYGNIQKLLSSVNNEESWIIDTISIQNLEHINLNLLRLNGLESEKYTSESSDHKYIVFYWAKFMGRYTKSMLNIVSYVQRQKLPNTTIITINMDKNILMSDSLKNTKITFNKNAHNRK